MYTPIAIVSAKPNAVTLHNIFPGSIDACNRDVYILTQVNIDRSISSADNYKRAYVSLTMEILRKGLCHTFGDIVHIFYNFDFVEDMRRSLECNS